MKKRKLEQTPVKIKDTHTCTTGSNKQPTTSTMPFVHISWLPKTCRTAAVRQQVADAVIKVSTHGTGSTIQSFGCHYTVL